MKVRSTGQPIGEVGGEAEHTTAPKISTILPDLIARLEQAGEGSRELDGKLARALGWHRVEPRFTRNKKGGWISPDEFLGVYPDGAPVYGQHGTSLHTDPPRWSTSCDAALALIGERLPGAVWRLGFDPDDGSMKAEIVTAAPECRAVRANHDAPAMALCLALLKAINQGETHDA